MHFAPAGESMISGGNNTTLFLNRTTGDGSILDFRKNGTTVGSIGTFTGYTRIGGNTNSGFIFRSNQILPWNNSTSDYADGTQDLGTGAGARFKDLYLSNKVYAAYIGASSDTDTSINFDTANTIKMFTGGDERIRIDSSGTVKISHAGTASEGLRVIQTTAARTSGGALGLFYDDQAGTTQPTLKVIQNGTGDILQLFDAANQVVTVKDGGNVGIGTNNPTMGKLQVTGPKYVITNSGKALGGIHVNPDSGATLGQFGGAISLSAGGNGSSAIAAVNDGGSDNDSTGLAFFVHSSGTGADDATEVVRIDQIGNVGIGNTDPSCPLEVGNGSSTYVKIRNASSGDVSSGYNIMSGSTTTTSLYGNADEGWTTLMSGGSIGFRVNQSASGFNPMNIDTSGRVTTPSQPGFLARGNTSQWIQGATSSWSTIVAGIANSNGSTIGVNLTEGSSNHWNGYDTGSDFNTGTGTFTAPVEGKYQIHGSLYASKVGTTASDYMHFLVYVNGQQVNQIYTMKGHNAAYAHDFSMNLSTILFLEASDYVQWKIYTTSSNMRVYGDHMSIGAHLLG
jgi:hypothetical protein